MWVVKKNRSTSGEVLKKTQKQLTDSWQGREHDSALADNAQKLLYMLSLGLQIDSLDFPRRNNKHAAKPKCNLSANPQMHIITTDLRITSKMYLHLKLTLRYLKIFSGITRFVSWELKIQLLRGNKRSYRSIPPCKEVLTYFLILTCQPLLQYKNTAVSSKESNRSKCRDCVKKDLHLTPHFANTQ